MCLNVMIVATVPYIIIGNRSDFKKHKFLYWFLIIGQISAIALGFWLAKANPFLIIVAVVMATVIIMSFLQFRISAKDRNRKLKCMVEIFDISHNRDMKKFSKDTGFEYAHRFDEVYEITQQHLSAEEFVELVKEKGLNVIVEVVDDHPTTRHKQITSLLSQIEKLDRKLDRWTAGLMNKRGNHSFVFFVFENQNDAIEFKLMQD